MENSDLNNIISGLNGVVIDPKTGLAKIDDSLSSGQPSIYVDPRETLGVDLESYQDQLGPNVSIEDPLLDAKRADAQSNWAQTGNAVGRVLANTIPTVIGNAASMLDFEDYANQDQEVGNAITNAMEEFKASMNEDYFPIYRDRPGEHLDVGDFAWWAENGSSLVESIGAFAITGMGSGALLSGLSKIGKAGQAAAALLNATGLNQAESITTATQVFDSTYNKEFGRLKAIQEQSMNQENGVALSDEEIDKQARQLAADAAAYSVNLNRVNIALNMTSAGAFIRPAKSTRQLLKAPGIKGKLLGESAQEFAEEDINLIAQKEGERFGEQREGYAFDINRSIDDLLTKEGLETGLLGALGGLGQTGGTHMVNNFGKNSKNKEELARYNTQQARISQIERTVAPETGKSASSVFKDVKEVTDLNNQLEEALNNKDYDKATEIGDQLFAQSAFMSFRDGTTEVLVDQYDKIRNMSAEEAGKRGYDINEDSEFYYKTRANEAMEAIKEGENIFNDYNIGSYINDNQVFNNRFKNKEINKKIADLDAKIDEQTAVYEKELANTRIDDTEGAEGVSGETEALPSYTILRNLKALRKANQTLLKNNNKEFNKLTSDTTQDKLAKKIVSDAEADIKAKQEAASEEVENATTKDDLDKVKKETSDDPKVSTTVDNTIEKKASEEQSVAEPITKPITTNNVDKLLDRYTGNPALYTKESAEIIDKLRNVETDDYNFLDFVEVLADTMSTPEGFNTIIKRALTDDKLNNNYKKFKSVLNDYYKSINVNLEAKEVVNSQLESQPRTESFTKADKDDESTTSKVHPQYDAIKNYVIEEQNPSTSAIQRKFAVGYNAAIKIVDQLESEGIVSEQQGPKPRFMLVGKNGNKTKSTKSKEDTHQEITSYKKGDKTTSNNVPEESPTVKDVRTGFQTFNSRYKNYKKDGVTIFNEDNDGNLIEQYNYANIDYDYIDNPTTLTKGTEVFYEVDLDAIKSTKDKYHSKLRKDAKKEGAHAFTNAAQVLIVHYDADGNRHIVGLLNPYEKSDTDADSLKTLRDTIFLDVVKNSDQKTGVLKTNINTKVVDKLPGRYNNTSTINKPNEVLKEGDPLLFGIGTKTESGAISLELPNVPKKYKYTRGRNVTPGAVYQLIPSSNGDILPYRVFTKKLNELSDKLKTEYEEKITKILEETDSKNWKEKRDELSKIIYLKYNYANGKFKMGKELLDVAGMLNKAQDSVMQVSLREINRNDTGYNDRISNEGIVETDMKPENYTHSSRIVFESFDKSSFKLSTDNTKAVEKQNAKASTEQISKDLVGNKPQEESSSSENLNDLDPQNTEVKDTKSDTSKPAKLTFDTGIKRNRRKANLDDINPKFRLQGNGKDYKVWNKKQELDWLKKNLPNVPVEVLANLKEVHKNGEDAYGMFYNSMVYLQESAAVGTTYHEAFHATFRLFLDEKSRTALYVEAAKIFGNKSDLKLEEDMAEAFREYIETKEATATDLPSKIRAFFKKLYNLLQDLVGKRVNMYQLFDRIDTGYYANKKIYDRNVSKFSQPAYRIQEYNPKEQAQRVDSVTKEFFMVLNDIRDSNPEYSDLTDIDVIKSFGIDALYAEVYNSFYKYRDEFKELGATDETITKYNILLNNLITAKREDGSPVFGKLAELSIRSLISYDIKVDPKAARIRQMFNTASEENLGEITEESTELEGWQTNYIEQSGKDKLSKQVKKLFRQVPVVQKNGKILKDDLGRDVHESFGDIFSFVQRQLSNIKDTDEFYAKFKSIITLKPSLQALYDNIIADESLKTQFKVGMTSNHTTFLSVIPKNSYDIQTREFKFDGEYAAIASNRRGINNVVIGEFREGSARVGMVSIEGKVDTTKAKALEGHFDAFLEELLKAGDVTAEHIDTTAWILNQIGFNTTSDELQAWYDSQEDIYANGEFRNLVETNINKIVKSLVVGKDVFDSEGNNVKIIAKITAASRLELLEDSFKNGEGKTVYSHLINNFLGDLINDLKSDYEVDGKTRSQNVLDFYKQDKYYKNSPWLAAMTNEDTIANLEYGVLDTARLDGESKGTKYSSMSPKLLTGTMINMWFNNGGNYAWNRVPTISDAPNVPMIKFEKYSKESVIDKLYSVALQENARIQQVKDDLKNTPESELIKNFHTGKEPNGLRYHFLPFLNKYKNRDLTNLSKDEVIADITEWMEAEYQLQLNKLVDSGVVKDLNRRTDNTVAEFNSEVLSKKVTPSQLEQWFYNSTLANTQIIALTSGDPAFYKRNSDSDGLTGVDFQKRNKQIWSPATRLDVSNKGVRENYTSVYLNDEYVKSKSYDDIKSALELDETLTPKDREDILKAYEGGINEADAQAYITLDRYMEIQNGLGRWTSAHQDTYDKLMRGESTGENWKLFQPIKPFYFGHSFVNGRVVPTQNKNSEFILMPALAYRLKDGSVKIPTAKDRANGYSGYNSTKLAKMLDFMQKDSYEDKTNIIDSVQFESTVKCGLHGNVKFENIENGKIHSLSNRDFGLQQETPEHHIDSKNLFGSQIRKLIFSDLPDDFEVTIDNVQFTKKELFDKYQEIISTDLKLAYDSVLDQFQDIEELQTLLLEEVISRNMGEDFIEALELVPDGKGGRKFKLPLYHPKISKQAESLINSIFKNRITKQKINGGAMIQVAGFGFSEELNVKVNPDTGNLEYMEVYAPYYSEKAFKPFMREDGSIDIDAIKEKAPALLDAIGYRIPTEDFYSMATIRIKGFTPRENGGGIMLPADITTIAGSDYDIDKMFMMFYNFEVSADNQDVRKIDYYWNKSAEDQSQAARDNAKIDVIKGILTHPSSFKKFINPGGFDTLSQLSKDVQKITGDGKEKLTLSLPSTFDEFSKRNMTGKDLIGIFANHNANHAVLQYTDVRFRKAIKFSGFDNINGLDLNKVKDANGRLISKNLAEFLAAVVDNAKDPVSSFLNLNTYTADVVATIVRLGYPIDTAVYFVSQPIIKEFTNKYFNEGGTIKAENDIKNELADYKAKVLQREGISTEEYDKYIYSNSTKAMEGYVAKGDPRTIEQFKLLDKFFSIKDRSTSLADLVRAMRADTKAAGPTMSDNEVFLRGVDRVLENESPDGLDNVGGLFNGTAYKMNQAFLDYGIKKPNKEIMKKNFPWMNESFRYVKDFIEENMKGRNLSVSDIELINYNIMSYATTNYSFFNTDQRADITGNLPNRLVAMKDKYPELSDVKLLNLLQKKSAGVENVSIDRLEFMNTGSMDSLQKDEIIQSWEYLLEHSNEEFIKLGEDLIKYSFLTAGFNFTPHSFSHLIPTSFYDKLVNDNGIENTTDSFNNFLDKMTSDSQETNRLFNYFIDQFYRNNYSNSAFVPSVNKDNTNISRTNDDFNKNPETIYVDTKKVKLKDFIVKGGKNPVFAPYIKKNIKGKIHLFKLSHNSSNSLLQYTIVEKLGVPNRVFEYDFGNSGINTIFTDNKLKSKNKETKVLEDSKYEHQDVVDDSLTSGVLDVSTDETIDEAKDQPDPTEAVAESLDPSTFTKTTTKTNEVKPMATIKLADVEVRVDIENGLPVMRNTKTNKVIKANSKVYNNLMQKWNEDFAKTNEENC